MRVEFRAIQENERDACLDLWSTVWPKRGRAFFHRYLYGDVEWLPYYTQVAVREGELVSAVQLCKRVVACGEFRLTMGGVANVATRPAFRGNGYNSECLRRAIAIMEADAMDFSLLFTGIPGYYARQGYISWPQEGLAGPIRPDFAPRATSLTVRTAIAEELPALRALYDAYNRQRPIAVQREEPYWRTWAGVSPAQIPDNLLTATDANGAVRGYVRYTVAPSTLPDDRLHDTARVEEFGVPVGLPAPQEQEITAALLEGVVARALAAGASALSLAIALEPAVVEVAKSLLETVFPQTRSSGMVRLLHGDNLLKSFAMAWNDRWIAAGRPRGVLLFATPYGLTRLDANGRLLQVQPGDADADTDCLPQETLFGLLFGTQTPVQATANVALHPLLTALFPPCAAVYWSADGF